jgi:RNA polymerase sigma-70 factor, ECF subfamily
MSSRPRSYYAPDDAAAGVLHGRFRRRTAFSDDPDRRDAVARAIVRAKQGDQDAIRFLYVRYADNVYGFVSSIVRDEHEAEDVTQHVFAKLLTVLPRYEPRDVPFSAWILRVARNVAVDHMRQRRAVPCEDVWDAGERSDDDVRHERSMSLRDALATLPDEQREVIVLRHLVGLSPGEIGRRLGRSEPSIHGLHHRGRGALRTALSDCELAPAVSAG